MTSVSAIVGGERRAVPLWYDGAIAFLSVFLLIFHIYCGLFGAPTNIVFLPVHLSTTLAILFLIRPLGRRRTDPLNAWSLIDLALILGCVFVAVYFLMSIDDFQLRVIALRPVDRILAIVLIVMVLEAVRRAVGWVLVLVALFFCFHTQFADHFPGVFFNAPLTFDALLRNLVFGDNAIFGIPISVMAAYIVLFLFFGQLLGVTGVGSFFTQVAFALFGHRVGGPAKAAAVSSGLFGMLTGSSISNVLTTGAFTIPMMKRLGYNPSFAAGVEAAAATGGAIVPPVMGAVAFMMAEFTGVSYGKVALSAAIPAVLYYAAIYWTVHFEARKNGLPRLPKGMMPGVGQVLARQGYLAIPILVVILMLGLNYSIGKVALVAAASVFVLSLLRPGTRLTPARLLQAAEDTATATSGLSAICACAGIIIGAIFATGLSFQVTQAAMGFASQNVFVLLLISALVGLVLGTGLTASAVYITMVASVVPILKSAGVNELAAHMFAFYYGVVSSITPPTALAAVAAAGLADVNPMKAMGSATRLGIAAYVVPLVFVYSPALILQGSSLWWTAIDVVVTGLGLFAVCGAIAGFFLVRSGPVSRIALAVAGILLIFPSLAWSIVGLVLLAGVVALEQSAARRAGAVAAPVASSELAPDIQAWLESQKIENAPVPADGGNLMAWGALLIPAVGMAWLGWGTRHATDPVAWVIALILLAAATLTALVLALRRTPDTRLHGEENVNVD